MKILPSLSSYPFQYLAEAPETVGHILNVFDHAHKLLIDLRVIFMMKFASNTDTGHVLIDSSGKLVVKCELTQ